MNTDKISILKDNIGKVIVGKDRVVERYKRNRI